MGHAWLTPWVYGTKLILQPLAYVQGRARVSLVKGVK